MPGSDSEPRAMVPTGASLRALVGQCWIGAACHQRGALCRIKEATTAGWERSRRAPYILCMAVTPTCDKCHRRNVVKFAVEQEEAWRAGVLNRWRNICPSCFDGEAERAGIRYRFVDVRAMPWSEMPASRKYGRKRR